MPPKRSAAGRRSVDGNPTVNGTNVSNEIHNTEVEAGNSGVGDGPNALSGEIVADNSAAVAASDGLQPSTSDASNRTGQPAGTSRGRGGRLLSQPKFAGRRSAAARQELEKAEAEKKRVEQAARAPKNANANRGSRREDGGRGGTLRGRGRGGYVGESDRKPSDAIASGPFSAGLGVKGPSKSSSHSGGGGHNASSGRVGTSTQDAASGPFGGEPRPANEGSGRSTRSKVKAETAAASSSLASGSRDMPMAMDQDDDVQPIIRNTEDGGYISSDEDEMDRTAGRVNVEDLTMIDLTGDDDIDPFAPVRIARVTHKGRSGGVNTNTSASKDKDKASANQPSSAASSPEKKQPRPKAKDVEIVSEKQRFMSVYDDVSSDEYEPPIKSDPDAPTAAASSTNLAPAVTDTQPQAPLSPERSRKGKERVKAPSSNMRPERPDYQTQEEIDEWERIQRDLQILKSELGGPVPGEMDNEGDTNMTGAQASADSAAKRDNKVYLFQFPPVLPDLSPIQVKPDLETVAETTSSAQADTAAGPLHVDGPAHIADEVSGSANAPTLPKLPPGYVGKLKIHASGRATLDWGGTSLCLSMGASSGFLQDIMVSKLPESKNDDVDAIDDEEAVAMSMGQVKGKFIVTPDFEKILQ